MDNALSEMANRPITGTASMNFNEVTGHRVSVTVKEAIQSSCTFVTALGDFSCARSARESGSMALNLDMTRRDFQPAFLKVRRV